MSLFSFLTRTSYTFDGMKSYETVFALLRRHWFVLFAKLFGFLLIAAVPVVAYLLLRPVSDLFWFSATIFFLFWWYSLSYAITMYLLDIWIVSDHRIIDSEQHGFFKRTTAEIHLAKVQDISVTVEGVIPTLLDYGNLEVQSAGATEKFFFKQIPHPNRVRDIIMNAHNIFVQAHPNDVEVHEQ